VYDDDSSTPQHGEQHSTARVINVSSSDTADECRASCSRDAPSAARNKPLPSSRRRAHQQQVRDIRAGDRKQQPNHAPPSTSKMRATTSFTIRSRMAKLQNLHASI
jgi:hypothetical protein